MTKDHHELIQRLDHQLRGVTARIIGVWVDVVKCKILLHALYSNDTEEYIDVAKLAGSSLDWHAYVRSLDQYIDNNPGSVLMRVHHD